MAIIENVKVVGARGKPLRVPVRNDDGDVLWKEKSEWLVPEQPEAQMEQATVKSLLREVLFGLAQTKSVGKPNDAMMASKLWNEIEHSPDGVVELKDSVYKWLVDRLLKREVTPTPQEKEQGIPTMSFARRLWGNTDWWAVVNQLKDKDERQSVEDVEPGSEGE